ncbi:MAG: 30S ribosome-binding factor RbfA [Clostridia bacterium]|nr:30S ribosome-binding factor RbfA [Clostridia bacterium]
MKIKMERVNAELAKQISKIIADDIKDPRMSGAIVGVTKLYTTPDLKYAKVYLSIFASDEEKKQEAYHTICRSKTFIRNMLKDRVQIRLLPELTFLVDDSVDYSIKIDKILNEIHSEDNNSDDTQA